MEPEKKLTGNEYEYEYEFTFTSFYEDAKQAKLEAK